MHTGLEFQWETLEGQPGQGCKSPSCSKGQGKGPAPQLIGSNSLFLKIVDPKWGGHNFAAVPIKSQGKKIVVRNLIHLIWLHFFYP